MEDASFALGSGPSSSVALNFLSFPSSPSCFLFFFHPFPLCSENLVPKMSEDKLPAKKVLSVALMEFSSFRPRFSSRAIYKLSFWNC